MHNRGQHISLLFLLITFSVMAFGQFNPNPTRFPDAEREEELSAFKQPGQYRRILMVQNKSPEARELAVKANNWRITSNVTYSIAIAGGLTSIVMANNASNKDQVGQAIGVGASSLIAAALGFIFHSFYTHYLYKAIDVYIYPKKQDDTSELTLG